MAFQVDGSERTKTLLMQPIPAGLQTLPRSNAGANPFKWEEKAGSSTTQQVRELGAATAITAVLYLIFNLSYTNYHRRIKAEKVKQQPTKKGGLSNPSFVSINEHNPTNEESIKTRPRRFD